jgi:hypothetical protein
LLEWRKTKIKFLSFIVKKKKAHVLKLSIVGKNEAIFYIVDGFYETKCGDKIAFTD